MRKWLVVMFAAIATPAGAQAPMAPASWLAGCWELKAGTRVTHEQWMAPLGGTMLGMSRTVVGDVTKEFEQVRIELRGGKLAYVAHPSNQSEAVFTASQATDMALTFENPTHDFPQRIIYRRVGTDSLLARIEGKRGEKVVGVDFPMARVGCGGR